MLKLIIGSALLGLVAAHPDEITTGPNGIQVVRRNVQTSISDIDVRLERAVGQAENRAQAAAYNATLMATMELTNAMSDIQTNVASQMADMAAASSTSIASIEAQMAALSATLTDTINTQMTDQINTVNTRLDALSTATASDANALSTAVDASVTQALSRSAASTTASIAAMNRTLNTGISGAKSQNVHTWHGGCSQDQNGGWNWMCLDRVTLNQAAPYFRADVNNRRFLVTVAKGIFFYNFFTINSSCNNSHSYLEVQGTTWFGTHGRSNWDWDDSHVVSHFKATNGQNFRLRTHAACGRRSYYSYSYHSRLDVTFVGTYA